MSTAPKEFRVFMRGRGTHVFYTAEDIRVESATGPMVKPAKVGRIINQGRGRFLERTFPTLNEAQAFCRTELTKDKTCILDVMRGDQILDTILDHDCQRVRELGLSIAQGLVSVIPVWLGAILLFKKASFLSPTAGLVAVAATVLVYLFVLWNNNWVIFESYVEMAIIFFLALMLIPALNKAHRRHERRSAPPALSPGHTSAGGAKQIGVGLSLTGDDYGHWAGLRTANDIQIGAAVVSHSA